MFAIQAAVSVVTAGLFASVFNIHLPMQVITALLLILVMIVLVIGRYKTLDITIKWVIIALALSTFIAVIYAFGAGFFEKSSLSGNFNWTKHTDILFLIAFVGWMPAPIDVSVWHSLWSLAKEKQIGKRPSIPRKTFYT